MEGYVKQISLFVPAEQHRVLRGIGKTHALSVTRLIKKGIVMVINEYYENGYIDEEAGNNAIDKEKENDGWNTANDSQEPSEC